MIGTPRFKSHLRVRVLPPDLTLFLGESGYRVLQGRLPFLLTPLIDGINTVDGIARRLKGKVTAFDVECGILLLEAEGVLLDADDAPQSGIAVLRDSLNISPEIFAHTLKTRRVRVLSFGTHDPATFVAALRKLGVQTTTKAAFTVALVDDYLCNELHDFNRQAIQHKRPWMLVKPTGAVLWLGPVFRPPDTACWDCLALRVRQNRQPEAFVESQTIPPTQLPAIPVIVDVALNMAAIETLKFLAQESNTPPTLMTLDLRNMALDKHAVTRLDNCPACSPRRPHPSPRPVIMRSSKKTHTNHGDRSVSAETTFRQYEHHISTITGIVDQVEPYHSETNGLVHTFVAGHLFAPTLEKDGPLRNVWKQTSAGRGMTPGQAKTGALCEALERYSGVYRGNEHRIAAKHRDIHDRAIHPNELMNFSERQYNNRKQQNIPRSSHDWIPAQFDESRTIEWTPVWSLTANSHHYVPTAYCYYGYPMQSDHDFCRADSNGNAAGNTLEEAILHGFMELIERDCAALWWYNRARRPAVDLRSFTLPYIEQLCDYYRTLGRDVWVLDITSDFQIPSFAALSASKRSPGREFLLGLGTHFDHVIALTRALTEMNQFLPTHLAGGSKRALRPTTKDIDYMKPDPNIPPRNAGDFPRYAGDDLRDDVMRCVNFSKERGMEMLVLNQTRSDVGLPVAKVIVPGLRQFWARFGPGRLYHIPVRLGWLKKSLTEEQLNPDRIAI